MTCSRYFLYLAIALAGWSLALGEDVAADSSVSNRDARSLHKKRLCRKYGICDGQQGYNGGYQGYQGSVPINIAISQSQSSLNGADGGHANGYYPNNYQYNGQYPQHGYNQGFNGYNQGYGGYNQGYGSYNQGYGGYNQGYRPGYNNGYGSNNNQFNGNYHSAVLGQTGGGGYGFQRPGNFFDEDNSGSYEDDDESGFGYARSLAVAKTKA